MVESNPKTAIQTIAVIGAGFIGHQIAQEFAMAGYPVALNDLTDEKLQQAGNQIQQSLQTLVQNDFITLDQADSVKPRITTNTSLKHCVQDADFVIEAVNEEIALKQQIFRQLDEYCPSHTILASNTSSLMPSLMASATTRPEQVLVTHYINPPYLLPVVELVRCPETSDDTLDTILTLYHTIGKSPIVVQKEVPGFIVNRLQNALLREALYLVEQGIASPQDVDRAITNSFGRRMNALGIFELCDYAGPELIQAVHQYIRPSLCSTTDPPSVFREMIDRQELGVKTGKGFYEWTPQRAEEVWQQLMQRLVRIAKWS
jgi:3-hydroxyacyl-CoA dehydrogenase